MFCFPDPPLDNLEIQIIYDFQGCFSLCILAVFIAIFYFLDLKEKETLWLGLIVRKINHCIHWYVFVGLECAIIGKVEIYWKGSFWQQCTCFRPVWNENKFDLLIFVLLPGSMVGDFEWPYHSAKQLWMCFFKVHAVAPDPNIKNIFC